MTTTYYQKQKWGQGDRVKKCYRSRNERCANQFRTKGTVHTVPGVTGGAILQALAYGEQQRGKSMM